MPPKKYQKGDDKGGKKKRHHHKHGKHKHGKHKGGKHKVKPEPAKKHRVRGKLSAWQKFKRSLFPSTSGEVEISGTAKQAVELLGLTQKDLRVLRWKYDQIDIE